MTNKELSSYMDDLRAIRKEASDEYNSLTPEEVDEWYKTGNIYLIDAIEDIQIGLDDAGRAAVAIMMLDKNAKNSGKSFKDELAWFITIAMFLDDEEGDPFAETQE